VATLALKLTLTPLLIGLSALAARRWGPGMGGWIVGLPFTSGPIVLILSIGEGWRFGGATAVGILAGTGSEAVFCLAYAVSAARFGWRASLSFGCLGFGACTLGLDHLAPSLGLAAALAVAGVAAALLLAPGRRAATLPSLRGEATALGDIASRMVVATAAVLVLTGVATGLGPTLTGLLSPFPLFGAVMMVYSQRLQGGPAGIAAARGMLWGLFGAASFFIVLAALLPSVGLAAFVPAAAADAVILGASLPMVRPVARQGDAEAIGDLHHRAPPVAMR
jgi:hypothetical protein